MTVTVAADVDATITASAGGVSRTATLRVSAPAPGGPLASFTSAHDDLIGGENDRGTVALTSPAPAGGATVRLASDDASITVPATVTIPAGAREATFEIDTAPVAESKDVRLTATFVTAAVAENGRGVAQPAAASFTLLIRLLPAVPGLTSVGPASGVQGTNVAATLTGASFWDGASLAVSGSGVTVSNVAVGSATSITATFAIASDAAAGDRTVTVTTAGGTSGGQTFTVTDANDAPVAGRQRQLLDRRGHGAERGGTSRAQQRHGR